MNTFISNILNRKLSPLQGYSSELSDLANQGASNKISKPINVYEVESNNEFFFQAEVDELSSDCVSIRICKNLTKDSDMTAFVLQHEIGHIINGQVGLSEMQLLVKTITSLSINILSRLFFPVDLSFRLASLYGFNIGNIPVKDGEVLADLYALQQCSVEQIRGGLRFREIAKDGV